jgi:hypothetical protein
MQDPLAGAGHVENYDKRGLLGTDRIPVSLQGAGPMPCARLWFVGQQSPLSRFSPASASSPSFQLFQDEELKTSKII